MSFNVALSGLNAASTELEVTGNNIANSATNGFKQSRVEFGDVYAATLYDTGTENAGGGVEVGRVAQQFDQGTVEFTSNNLDLAISGDGFFVVEDTDGTLQYTRAGAYAANKDGFVVNSDNQELQVYPAVLDEDNVVESYDYTQLETLYLPNVPSQPKSTEDVTLAVNLDATESVPPVDATDEDAEPPITSKVDPSDPSTFNHSTSFTVYDSVGAAHTASVYYRKMDPDDDNYPAAGTGWESYLYVDGEQATDSPQVLAFSEAGELDLEDANGNPTTSLTFTPAALDDGASLGNENGELVFDLSNTTQYGSEFSVNSVSQDGYSSGRLAGVNIDNQGEVFASYTNGQSVSLGKVALANFPDEQGLRPVGGSNWVATSESGDPILGEAGTSSFGIINSGALEASNVDIAEQLVKLITAQRNFQANTEVISSSDQLTQSIINIR